MLQINKTKESVEFLSGDEIDTVKIIFTFDPSKTTHGQQWFKHEHFMRSKSPLDRDQFDLITWGHNSYTALDMEYEVLTETLNYLDPEELPYAAFHALIKSLAK